MVEFLLGVSLSSAVWYLISCASASTAPSSPVEPDDLVVESDNGLVVKDAAGVRYTFHGSLRVRKVSLGYVLERRHARRYGNLPCPLVSWIPMMTIPEENYRGVELPHAVRTSK